MKLSNFFKVKRASPYWARSSQLLGEVELILAQLDQGLTALDRVTDQQSLTKDTKRGWRIWLLKRSGGFGSARLLNSMREFEAAIQYQAEEHKRAASESDMDLTNRLLDRHATPEELAALEVNWRKELLYSEFYNILWFELDSGITATAKMLSTGRDSRNVPRVPEIWRKIASEDALSSLLPALDAAIQAHNPAPFQDAVEKARLSPHLFSQIISMLSMTEEEFFLTRPGLRDLLI